MKSFRYIVLPLLAIIVASSFLFAQKTLKSPPAGAKGNVNGVDVEITYHQPSAKGRKVMGDVVPYGEVWRTGANNATTITFSKDVKIEGKTLAAGKYALFTIPGENEWTIIFSKNTNQWGSFNYDQSEDALRVKVKPGKTDKFVETFNIAVEDENVVLSWENTRVKFKIEE